MPNEPPAVTTRILLVDDEPKILSGLRRMLAVISPDWTVDAANGGREALEQLTQNAYDVVLSDMRMPEMDGATLLNIVKARYPNVIRFILSGFSDKAMVLRTIGSADQFISKPCNPSELKDIIARALEARRMIRRDEMRRKVSEMKKLPTLPDLYLHLQQALASPNSSLEQIVGIIEHDITVSAKILQLVNSAFFGLKHNITSLRQALMFIGTETLKGVVLTSHLFSQFSPQETEAFEIQALYQHSFMVGMLAQKISSRISTDAKFLDEVAMAGILHDIGKILLMRSQPEEYKLVLARTKADRTPQHQAEQQILGATHSRIGAYLMSVWGLPESIVRAICFHHEPGVAPQSLFNTITAVYVANTLCHRIISQNTPPEAYEFDKEYLAHTQVDSWLPEWEETTRQFQSQQLPL